MNPLTAIQDEQPVELGAGETSPLTPPASDTTSRKNMLLLIQLRWFAVIGQIATIAFVQLALDIALPLQPMAVVLGTIVAFNLLSYAWVRNRTDVSNRALLFGLVLDVAALTAQLYLSGGATNPFTALYLLQLAVAAVLLDARSAWGVVAFTFVSFVALTQFNQPLQLSSHSSSDLFRLHIIGMLVCFALDAALLVSFVTRITRNLRSRDARLAALKQRAAEEDHIVRMGLLASGAAHELGTPLASLSVILGDWQHMPEIERVPELAQDIAEMQAAVQRCKSIVTGILLSAGEARGESPKVTTVNTFLDEVVGEWRAARPGATLSYGNHFGADLPIVSDSTLKQVVNNLLDNAFEASPKWVGLSAEQENNELVLKIVDHGPGFKPDMITQVGKPYQSSKGRLGGGLGLFLVVNVVRKLGGSVTAGNRLEGGAIVTIHLPLDMLKIGARHHA